MRQAFLNNPGKIEYREIEKPDPRPENVVVKIKYIGICGSDIHVFHGKHPYTSYPVVQGHEVSAEVVAVGDGVSGYKAGDRVTVMPQVFCGQCYPCRHGDYHICNNLKVMGFQTTGMASEYFETHPSTLIPLPDGVDYQHAALIEPLAVACHALQRAGGVNRKNVLILGAGPIGNLTAQAAKGLGANKVMITDISDFRLQLAKECGADYVLNTKNIDLSAIISEHFGDDKADVILECVGANETIAQAILNARKGSTIVVVGVFGSIAHVDIGLVQDRELQLVGTLMYKRDSFVEAIELINSGKINFTGIISAQFSFSDFEEAYRFIEQGKDKAMKVLIDMEQ